MSNIGLHFYENIPKKPILMSMTLNPAHGDALPGLVRTPYLQGMQSLQLTHLNLQTTCFLKPEKVVPG